MKNTEQKPAKTLTTLKSTEKEKYSTADAVLNEKHQKANDFIKKVRLKF